jgi:replicative DNA helicase
LERHTLGAFLEDANFLRAAQERGLNADCYTTTTHKRIYEKLCELQAQGTPVDSFTLVEQCGCDPDVCACIADCMNGCVLEFSYVMCHVAILKKKSQLRQLQHVGQAMVERAEEPGVNPESLAKGALDAIRLAGIEVGQ